MPEERGGYGCDLTYTFAAMESRRHPRPSRYTPAGRPGMDPVALDPRTRDGKEASVIGTTLDKYEVLQKVGEGGMATVYRGRHATLKRDVAIKVLHPHLSSSPRNRKRFAREARAIEQLHHANILEIFDYSGVDAHDCYIITEFVQGETLTDLLSRRGVLPSGLVALIGLELCDALAYAHDAGILHRDFKPDNVMVRWDGTVKLMDFGIARFLDETQVTMTGALVGSPAFMSPEQAREQDLDGRSDLFALGTVLYRLVTGHLPFSGSNASLILKNVIEGTRPSVSELAPAMSPRLADVVERLMATQPSERFPHAQDVAAELRGCLGDAGLLAEDGEAPMPEWSLRTYLEDAVAWEQRLDEHLRAHLLVRGKHLLAAGEHLEALRLFNRLLSMDEDNEEVLALIHGLHREASPSTTRRGPALPLVAFGVLGVLLGGLGWALQADEGEGVVSVEPVVAPPEPPARPRPQPVDLPVVVPAPPAPVAKSPPEPTPQRPPSAPRATPSPRPVAPSGSEPVAPTAGTASLDPPEDAAPVDAPATLSIRSGRMTGNVWIDGRKVGTTREDHVITPGAHDVEIRGMFLIPHTERIFASSGEDVVLNVKLQAKPARVRFDAAYDVRCVAYLDSQQMGSLGELDRTLSVASPDRPHIVSLSCPGEDTVAHTYKYVAGEDTFPPR